MEGVFVFLGAFIIACWAFIIACGLILFIRLKMAEPWNHHGHDMAGRRDD